MILFFIFKKRSWQLMGLLFGVIFGWVLGVYQMLKGAHFFGDTLITMLCCFLLASIIAKVMKFYKAEQSKPN
jgi:membrane-associated PAP2 superfamily phosphatase